MRDGSQKNGGGLHDNKRTNSTARHVHNHTDAQVGMHYCQQRLTLNKAINSRFGARD
jgi:hypothetical protein